MEKSEDRLSILKKIDEYEIEQKWDQDVENDPPSLELMPDQIDYLNKKFSSKIKTFLANRIATSFFEKLIKNDQFIIKEVKGIENFLAVKGGAIITSNHFNPFDSYAVWRAIKPYTRPKRLWRIIREGNYTNPPGQFGFIMRNCNTLPLSRNRDTMRKFFFAVDKLLKKGEKIMVYPEQGMWWNYRKPRPLKNGAFKFAVDSSVPVIPVFITMEDSENLDGYGFPIQKYIINILPAIYPDPNLNNRENIEALKEKNYEMWKDCYEKFYNLPLTYLTKEVK